MNCASGMPPSPTRIGCACGYWRRKAESPGPALATALDLDRQQPVAERQHVVDLGVALAPVGHAQVGAELAVQQVRAHGGLDPSAPARGLRGIDIPHLLDADAPGLRIPANAHVTGGHAAHRARVGVRHFGPCKAAKVLHARRFGALADTVITGVAAEGSRRARRMIRSHFAAGRSRGRRSVTCVSPDSRVMSTRPPSDSARRRMFCSPRPA